MIVGGIAPQGTTAVARIGRRWVAVTGEYAALMADLAGHEDNRRQSELLDERGVPRLAASVAEVDTKRRTLRLSADWSGAFPLYWNQTGDAFVFSTLSGVLASFSSADVDAVGLVSWVKDGYCVGGRTCSEGIRRVQAGQLVRFSEQSGEVELDETSRAWVGPEAVKDPERASEAVWRGLVASVDSGLPKNDVTGLMLSGGWDSRTLLAAAASCRPRTAVMGLAHGDTESRELHIVADLAEEQGVRFRRRAMEPEEFDAGYLRSTHEKCGTAQFPYWRASAHELSGAGARCVTAGVLGEVLGGHYGPAMSMRGWTKIRWVMSQLLLGPRREESGEASGSLEAQSVRDLLLRGLQGVEKFFHPDFWHGGEDLPAAVAGALEEELSRLRRRGITSPDRLAEAYLTEHRGGQYINAQLRTSGIECFVALPFARRSILSLASRIPFNVKVHNQLNRQMLDRAAPDLLEYPLAATLIPASAPVILQEASRAIRKGWEAAGWWLENRTGGRTRAPALSWINFHFLSESDVLRSVADDFQWEGWSQETVGQLADAVCTNTWRGSLHEPVLQLLKLYSLDLTLRP